MILDRTPYQLQANHSTTENWHDSGFDQASFVNASRSGSPSLNLDCSSEDVAAEAETFNLLVRLQTAAASISTALRRSEYSV